MRPSIVITELPYQTNKSDFVATTARLVEEQKLTGEQEIRSWASLIMPRKEWLSQHESHQHSCCGSVFCAHTSLTRTLHCL